MASPKPEIFCMRNYIWYSFLILLLTGCGGSSSNEQITSVDTIAPKITPPSNISVSAVDGSGAPVTHEPIAEFLLAATASDNIDTSVTVSNDAPDIFPVGNTTVTFSAQDASGNQAQSATAVVTVEPFIDLTANNSILRYQGRWNFDNPEIARIYWQGSSVSFNVKAESVKAILETNANGEQFRVIIDGIPAQGVISLQSGKHQYLLAEDLDPNKLHLIELFKETSSFSDYVDFFGLQLGNGAAYAVTSAVQLKIAFFGDSNMDGTSLYSERDSGDSGSYYAYPATVSRMLGAEMRLMAIGGATLSGAGNNNVMHFIRSRDWPNHNPDYTDNFEPNVVVVNAGANDINDVTGSNQKEVIKERYTKVIQELRSFYGTTPHIILLNAYGWDVNEPANYTRELVNEVDGNMSVLLFPWNWEQWHGSMVEHAGQARLLAHHIESVNSEWKILHDAEIFDAYGHNFDVANGSFENVAKGGFNAFGWRYHDDGVERIDDSTTASDGDYFIRLSKGQEVHQGLDASGDFEPGPAKTGQLYEITAMARAYGGSSVATIAADFERQNLYQRENRKQESFDIGSSWEAVSFIFSAPVDSWKLYLVLQATEGSVEFDNVRMSNLN